jgi:type III secretory pathway component EscS
MNKEFKNWVTTIIGILITIMSTYKWYTEDSILYIIVGYTIGIGLMVSYTKLANTLFSILKDIVGRTDV